MVTDPQNQIIPESQGFCKQTLHKLSREDKEKGSKRDKMLRGIQIKALEWKILLNIKCNYTVGF